MAFRKFPSPLPGKSHVHLGFRFLIGMIVLLVDSAANERLALERPASLILTIFVIIAACARLRLTALAKSREGNLQFEELPPPAVLALGLHGD
jgi:hypothetical protein